MVLAAGLGTRIREAAAGRPKPLVPVAGKALIDYALDELARGGVSRAVVNVHHLADMVEAHLKGRTDPLVTISDERERLMETGGGLVQASSLLGEDAVFCTNTDAILVSGDPAASPVRRLREAWDDGAMDALLLLVPTARTTGYQGEGDFALGADGRLSWEGSAKLVFTGLQVIHPRLWAGREAEPQSTKLFWDDAMARGRLFGLVHEGAWMHVGDPQGLAEAEARLS
jgi:MurNAc alpha-1-phosphate uridylyltransferase